MRKKVPHQIHVAMGDVELRIVLVEKQGMAGLAVRLEVDPLIETALGIGLMTVVAVELPALFHGWNVRRIMALMIEAEHIGIARLLAHELKLRMIAGEGRKDLGITARRPRHFKDDLLGRMRPQMKRRGRKFFSLLRGRFHDAAVVVTGSAMQIRHRFHPSRPEVFHMADGTGTVLDDVWLVQIKFLRDAHGRMLFVARLAFAIDRSEIEAAMKPVAHDGFELGKRMVAREHRALVVTACAILRIRRVAARNRSCAEEFFAGALLRNELLVNDDARDAAGNGDEAGEPARHAPGMLPFVITEIAFVALGDLFLGASRRGHDSGHLFFSCSCSCFVIVLGRSRASAVQSYGSTGQHEHDYEKRHGS